MFNPNISKYISILLCQIGLLEFPVKPKLQIYKSIVVLFIWSSLNLLSTCLSRTSLQRYIKINSIMPNTLINLSKKYYHKNIDIKFSVHLIDHLHLHLHFTTIHQWWWFLVGRSAARTDKQNIKRVQII
jgi:hypothetical protein